MCIFSIEIQNHWSDLYEIWHVGCNQMREGSWGRGGFNPVPPPPRCIKGVRDVSRALAMHLAFRQNLYKIKVAGHP